MRDIQNILIVLLAVLALGGCNISEDSGSNDQSENNDPTISGNPAPAVLANEMYNFEPVATDPNGDALIFQISNKPAWASFDSSTGRMFGQPTLGDVGDYDNIVISVSDGTTDRSLPAFSVTVTQFASGKVTLSWSAPTQNSDGSPLLDLAGYDLHYGTASRMYDHKISIDNASITTYVVDNLVPGTYYFALTSFNSSGIQSDFSGEAVRTVN